MRIICMEKSVLVEEAEIDPCEGWQATSRALILTVREGHGDPGPGVRGVGHGQRCQGKGNASSARGAPHLAGCWWALGAPHALCHPGRRDRSLRDQPKEPQQVRAARGHCHTCPKGTMCLSSLGRTVIQTWLVSFNFKRVTKPNEKL